MPTSTPYRTILELMSKGVYAPISLSTPDLDRGFARLVASGVAEVIQEPTRRPFGGRDCAFLDPAGNLVRLIEAR